MYHYFRPESATICQMAYECLMCDEIKMTGFSTNEYVLNDSPSMLFQPNPSPISSRHPFIQSYRSCERGGKTKDIVSEALKSLLEPQRKREI